MRYRADRMRDNVSNTEVIKEINFTKKTIVVFIKEESYKVIGTKIDDYGVGIVLDEFSELPDTTYDIIEDIVKLFTAVFNLKWDWDKGIAVSK